MSFAPCIYCGKENESRNYCDWTCAVAAAKKAGGREHLPNGLPVGCIKFDGTMLEHEHGDHPDYKFPVEVEWLGEVRPEHREEYEIIVGSPPTGDDVVRAHYAEIHALIYTDGSIALTMYEACYAMWAIGRSGENIAGNLWKRGEYKLVETSLAKIRALAEGSRT